MTRQIGFLAIVALATMSALVGCKTQGSCRDGSLFVTIAADGTSAGADTFEVVVTVDGAQTTDATVPHTAGSATGTLEIDFPSGYPKGRSVSISINALSAGTIIGSGTTTMTPAGGCDVATVSVSSGVVGGDDMTAPNDMTAPPDLTTVCVFQGAEDCFNGVDDDCNGLTDCADPACNSVGVCVPDEPGLAIGIQVPVANACPTRFSQATTLNQGLSGGAGCTGCNCATTDSCSTKVYDYGANTCPGTTFTLIGSVSSAACFSWPATHTSTKFHADPFTYAATCSPSGTPAVTAAAWTSSTKFCQADAIGKGCQAGYVCAPKAAQGAACALGTASQSCGGAYAPVMGGTWYTSFSDLRTCGASCSCGAPSGGNCTGSSVQLWTAAACGGGFSTLTGDGCNYASIAWASSSVAKAGTAATCGVGNVVSGSLTPTGPNTLCCM